MARHSNKWWVRLVAGLLVVVLLLVGVAYLITNSDWGRERVRRYVEGLIQDNSHGIVHIGSVSGNLLHGITLHDVTITDSARAPFVKADEIWAKYSLNTLRGKRIELNDVKLVRPVIVLDEQPGGKWNYDRIFPRDTVTHTGVKKTGWGTWIRFSNVTIVNGDLTIRSPWDPGSVTPAERADKVRAALGPNGRLKILQVAKGYQKESSFHAINGLFPLVRLEDPGYKSRMVDVAALKMIAEPFRPPVADVRGLTGTFEFTGDSVWWKGARVTFPGTKASGDGRYYMASGDLHLRLHGDPVRPADIRWAMPNLPEDGSGKLDFGLDWTGDKSVYLARNMDVTLEKSHVTGKIEATVSDTVAFRDANLRFANLDTRLLTKLFPTMTFPRPLTLTGNATFDGGEHALNVNGDVLVDDRLSGRSHLVAVGVMGLSKGIFTARDLHVRMLPLQLGLAKAIAPTLRTGGTVTGTATLNGSSAEIMTASAMDVTHVELGSLSRATGRAAMRARGIPWFDVDVVMHPLALATIGRYMPAVGLRGSGNGPLKLKGFENNLAINTQLTFPDSGFLDLRGTMDLFSKEAAYNLAFNARQLNASTIVTRAPKTSLTAVGTASGRGFIPETMQAHLVAAVAGSSVDTVSLDSANVDVSIANGLATIDTLSVDLPQGIVEAKGTIGMTPAHNGTVSYHIAIDSLSRFAGLVSTDTGVVKPRPGILAGRVARAKADSSRIARATEVERAVTGRVMPRTVVDTPATVRKNELSGSIRADGVATGNIKNFSAKGTASGSNIVARGNTVGSFTADYDWINGLTPQSQVRINAQARTVHAAGFALDSVGAKLTYQKPNGTVQLVVSQDNQRTYTADAGFTLDKIRSALTLNTLKLQFDTSVWASTGPAAIHWGQAGADVEHLELRNGVNGRIYVNGFLPKEGNANLDVALDNVNVGDLVALTESDINAQGLISLNIHATGTLANPVFKGVFGATDLVYNGSAVPEIHGNVDYANQTLTGRAEAMRAGKQPFLIAEGTVPINLALSGVTGSRFPADREIALNINADSLPLELLPQFGQYVSNVKGQASGAFKVGGSLNHPKLSGQFAMHQGAARVVPAGINLTGIEASVRMLGDTVVIDSIAAYSKGRILITGGLGVGSVTAPSFDLKLQTQNAQVLNNHRGNLTVSTNLAMVGPFKDAHVTGNVRILDGVLDIPPSDNKNLIGANDPAIFNVIDTAVMADRELFPTQSRLLANLRMDVSLHVDRDVFVRSREANVEVYSDGDLGVHVNRAKQTLVLDGVLLTERGVYTFMTRKFNIKRGSATFINSTELNPTLQGTAEYQVVQPNREAINIQIVVGGTLRNPNISLTSDAAPPIAQSDLLSYLAFGQTSSSLVQLEGSGLTNGSGGSNPVGAGAALASRQLAGIAIGVLTDQFAGEAARSIGVDVFTITPADVQTDVGNFLRGTQFELGKYIKSHTFVEASSPLDPKALVRPGIHIVHRFGGLKGYRLETGVDTRYLLQEPTLARDQSVGTTSAFGAFLIREWRF